MKRLSTVWFVGAGHFLAFACLLLVFWERIERHLGKYTTPILIGYALFSLISLVIFGKFTRNAGLGKQSVMAALIPYSSSVLAYLGIFAISGQLISMTQKLGMFPVLFVAGWFPYLLMWGPALSAVNVVVVFLGYKVRE